ncbi:hypothetical protein BH09CHL1_BH09CHL1_02950 [soil metagenome]
MTDLPDDLELNERLHDLSRQVLFPPTPRIAAAVVRSISSEPRAASHRTPFDRSRFLLWTAVLLVFVAATIAAVPSTRHAVARWLDVPGIHISWTDEDKRPDVQTEIRLGLGDQVSLESVAKLADFAIEQPATMTADEVYYSAATDSGLVSFVYFASDDLPAVEGTDIGLLITQFDADPNSVWANKSLFGGRAMDVVRIDGIEGMWIPDTHIITIQPVGAGELTDPLSRSTGSVLIWNRDGVTYRIEGTLSRDAMLAIAESMEPIAP